LAFS
jgi:hypothetical protein